MYLSIKNKAAKIFFVAIVTLVSIHLWSFRSIDDLTYEILEAIMLAGLVLIVIFNSHILIKKGLIFKNYIHFFIWIPLLSVLGAYLYHDQAPNLSLLLLRSNLFWLLYFVLHIFNISKKQVISLLIFIGLVWIFLTIVQQFTYPSYFFYSRDDEIKSVYRAGIYRFMISGRQYGLFLLLYFFYKFLTTSKFYNLLFVFIGIAGFFYYGTRQFALAAAACMVISIFFLQGRAKWKYLLFAAVCAIVVINFKDYLFGNYIEMTNEQLEYGDNIRILSANFFLHDYWPGWGAKIIGNGPAHIASDYGKEMYWINTFMRYFRSDVGVIGAYNQFGILYVINIILINIKGLRIKFLNSKDKYLKLFFFNSIILLIVNQPYASEGIIPFYCLTLYLIDKSIRVQNEKNNLPQAEIVENAKVTSNN